MNLRQKTSGDGPSIWARVAQGLYRSTASRVYFAHVRIGGKLFRQSLKTDDRKLAERKLTAFRRSKQRVDPKLGKTTLAELCDRYAETLSHLSQSSIKSKTGILTRIKAEWPGGSQKRVADIKPSDCERWLGRQAERVGRSHANAYIQLFARSAQLRCQGQNHRGQPRCASQILQAGKAHPPNTNVGRIPGDCGRHP